MREYTKMFYCYESYYKTFERLKNKGKKEAALEYIDSVMRYGLYGEKPPEESDIWDYGFDGVLATISSAKSKQKYYIPQNELEEMLSLGYTQKQMANHYECSEDTIQRRLDQYGLRGKKHDVELGF